MYTELYFCLSRQTPHCQCVGIFNTRANRLLLYVMTFLAVVTVWTS